ncbi:hypothetical protein QZM28_12590 [Burkholderia multivorans]|nr:hypothetical protein [Burkholderia multivorans]
MSRKPRVSGASSSGSSRRRRERASIISACGISVSVLHDDAHQAIGKRHLPFVRRFDRRSPDALAVGVISARDAQRSAFRSPSTAAFSS